MVTTAIVPQCALGVAKRACRTEKHLDAMATGHNKDHGRGYHPVPFVVHHRGEVPIGEHQAR